MAAFVVSAKSAKIIGATVGAVGSKGPELTKAFYKRMFTTNPELQNVFNMTHQRTGDQPKALFDSIVYGAKSAISEGNQVMPMGAVLCIAHKHCSLDIQPAQYDIVGRSLLDTIAAELTSDPEVLGAWGELYGKIAGALIGVEESLYVGAEKAGGWRGKKEMKVVGRRALAEGVVGVSFVPADGSALPTYQPGQYISVWAPGAKIGGYDQPRQYSLTSVSGFDKTLDVAVYKDGDGKVSNYMHTLKDGETIPMTAPFGPLAVPKGAAHYVVVSTGSGIAGEIGILRAMLHHKLENPAARIDWVYGTTNSKTHAFRDDLIALQKANSHFHRHVFYAEPAAGDKQGTDYQHKGLLTTDSLKEAGIALNEKSHVLLCGSPKALRSIATTVQAAGVPDSQVHTELFTSGLNHIQLQ